ncbi:TPA: hypothetical protein U9I80_002075 [Acinetobacter baumannii]|uniref:hypothetical protein n=1 Tax=Acinetobacter baumannii TaxID=470 RepID=UPI002AD6DB7D|nr:hypothetical protein [Acinetobacter baumannii]HEN9555466.1 hypothetical protein [Acinetobacter baumannii]
MDNYKIKVKDEAESKEAQELFFELGFQWCKEDKGVFWETTSGFIFANGNTKLLMGGVFMDADAYAPVTIPQLRDLVVLKRNDVKDANHTYIGGGMAYKTCEDICYLWARTGWEYKGIAHNLVPIKKHLESATGRFDENGEHHITFNNGTEEKDPALISGAEALRALADGKEVEYNWLNQKSSKWMLISEELKQFNLYEILSGTTEFGAIKFRLKPQTIKVELELPKPFEPRDGDDCFIVDSEQEDGFYRFTYSENSGFHQNFIQFGAYKTEDDVKKAVEQLRKIRGTNS